MQNRSVITIVLLSIVTCGIYALYWFYVTAQDLNRTDTDGAPLMNYLLAILLGIVTCGIYEIYWLYKFYEKVDRVTGGNNAILNFVLGIFLTPLAGMALAQDQINKKF